MSALPDDARFVAAFALALGVTLAATPLARRLAVRIGFYDHPTGYKKHGRATPYLGGFAVVAGFLVGAGAATDDLPHLLPLLGTALGLHALGTLDDRRVVAVAPRLAGQVVAAVVLWATGWGWAVFEAGAADLALTTVWVLGVVNAFNLMDNIDGAAAGVAGVSALGAGTLALVQSEPTAAVAALAIAGTCAGFLPYNLARPSRIFLGDGGSTPIGVVVAASIMAISNPELGWVTPIAAAPLVGVVIFDTALVLVARRRRGAKLFRGDRNHITHRLLARLGSERMVVLLLCAAQGLLCALAIVFNLADQAVALEGAGACFVAMLIALALLEGPRPAPLARGESA